MTAPKIATCCYCGTRATLVLTGERQHELSCSNCGAPLHDLKMLRADHRGRPDLVKSSPIRKAQRNRYDGATSRRKKKGKRRKSFKRQFLEEAWDMIEDIFD